MNHQHDFSAILLNKNISLFTVGHKIQQGTLYYLHDKSVAIGSQDTEIV